MGSRSSSSQASNITDKRVGAANDAIVLQNQGGAAQVTRNEILTITDGGATRAALDANLRVTDRAFDFSGDVVSRSLNTVNGVVNESFYLVGETVDDAFAQVNRVNADAAALVTTANTSLEDIASLAIDKVEASTRSDAQQSFNKLIEVLAIVAGGGIIAWMIKK